MTQFVEIPANNQSIAQRKPVYGVGVNDAKYMLNTTVNGKAERCPYYRVWENMLERCYRKESQEKQPTYKECSVEKSWLTFSIFRKWMEKQDWRGRHLDKDILKYGNKIYSAESCIFVSQEVNSLLNKNEASRGSLPQGVDIHKTSGKYRAQCNDNGKKRHLGLFQTQKEAEKTYLLFKSKLISNMANSEGIKNNKELRDALLRHSAIFSDKAIGM